MAHKNPIGKIKDVATTGLTSGLTTGTHLAKTVGGTVAGKVGTVAGSAAGAVQALVGHKDRQAGAGEQERTTPDITISPDQPVNVTEALDLDPAPVDKPKGPKKPQARPTTSIDAAADPSEVDVTPADVAEAVSKHAQEGDEDADKPAD